MKVPDFRCGQQPCNDFQPTDDLFVGSGNVHECFAPFDHDGVPRCGESGGRVSFCENCNRDHHSGGWQSCKGARSA